MDHDSCGLPLHQCIWYVLSLSLDILIGTLALFSRRCFVIQLWLSVHDSGPKLHKLPRNDRLLRIPTWLWVNSTLYRSLQRGIWQKTSLSRLRCWVFGDACPACFVRCPYIACFCANWPD